MLDSLVEYTPYLSGMALESKTKWSAIFSRCYSVQSTRISTQTHGFLFEIICLNIYFFFFSKMMSTNQTIMGSRATSEAAQLRKLNSTFQQLADNLFPRSTATTNLLSRLEHFTAEASTLELLNLNDCLETLFHGKSSTTGDFDSSSSSPQILPGIQDSFGPCAPKGLVLLDIVIHFIR
ncbi:hypothetical protein EGR_06538 [Echinococcus granulosus]|uniref:Uncharacterized protein n=1 Tax=Echinococcus granulosus TaxID=6210 RepID=W6UCS7_ECHGR|nr:hypothetical protein EGR_06538 [Echinococcus granulosus]EUB58551.1 hypothetical protein EGR_06538 [Echinococcus granulosus]